MLTAVQRLELAWPAEAMLHVIVHGADESDPDFAPTRRLLLGAVDEALSGLADRERRKIRTRLDRTMRAFLRPLAHVGSRVDLVGVIAFKVLAALLDAEILVLPSGTPLSDALDVMLPALQRAADDPEAGATAEREWPAALRRLQAAGLYGAFTFERDAA